MSLDAVFLVPRHREVLGAYGAAVSVQEKMRLEKKGKSIFRGLDSAIKDRMKYTEKVCRADPHCHNRCKLKIYNFDGRRSIWGGECGRYESTRSKRPGKENFFELRQEVWQAYMTGVYTELQDGSLMEIDNRPTVGMQRALYGHQLSVMLKFLT